MKVYIALIFSLIFLNFFLRSEKHENNKKAFLIIAFFIFFIISALRTQMVGADTKQYCWAFDLIKEHSLEWSFENLRFEKGFIVFCKLLSYISMDSQILIIVSSFIIISVVFYFIKENSVNPFLSVLLFVLLNYYFMYISAMRQALAIACCLIGYTFFYKKEKYKPFILTIILASLFHTSALCMLILLAITNKISYNKNLFGLTILVSLISFVFSDFIFILIAKGNQYSYYINSDYAQGSNIAGYINYIIVFCMLIFSYVFGKDKIKKDKNFNRYLIILSINLILSALAIKTSIFGRLSTYFNIFNCIYLPYVMNNIKLDSNRKIMKTIVYFSIFSYWIIVSLNRPEWYGCIPYISIL